jgi:hypothetical protein
LGSGSSGLELLKVRLLPCGAARAAFELSLLARVCIQQIFVVPARAAQRPLPGALERQGTQVIELRRSSR